MSTPNKPGFNAFREGMSKAPPPSKGGFEKDPWELTNFKLEPSETCISRFLMPNGSFYMRAYHFWNRPGTCTYDIPVFQNKCVYCFYVQKGKEAAKAQGKGPDGKLPKSQFDKLWQRTSYEVELIDFRWFHRGFDPDDKDKPILIRCGNEDPVPQRNRCPHCAKGETRIFGGRKIWELSPTQYSTLVSTDAKIGETCITLINERPCGRKITTIGFACGNGHELVDENTLIQMPPDELNKFVSTMVCCNLCDWEGLPIDMLVADDACPTCGGGNPVRATLFDKNISITCNGQTQSDGKVKKTYNFDQSAPFSDLPGDLVAPFSVFTAPADVDKAIAELLKPRDLAYTFRPEYVDRTKFSTDEEYVMAVLDKQAEQLKQPNPYKASGQPQTTPYQSQGQVGGGFRRR